MVVEYLLWTLVVAMLLYLLLMLVLTLGWFRLKTFNVSSSSLQIKVSVVVAVRNEEENITQLLKDLAGQNYPDNLYEIIIADDHSEDNTMAIVTQFVLEHPKLQITLMHAGGKGKKAALAESIELAKGELIVTTDGDCSMGPEWLASLAAYFVQRQPALIIAPVVYQNEKGFLQKLFSLDFASLVAAGAGSVGAGLPFMGNGANLAFSKQAWKSANSKETKEDFVSGDDVFLIHRIAKNQGRKSIHFLKIPSVVVHTKPPLSFRDFIQQRIRWASKAKGYRLPWAMLVAVVVLGVNLLLALPFFIGFYKAWFFVIYGLFIFLKLLIDLPLLHGFTSFTGKRKLLGFSIPLALIYPLYIVIAAFPALFFRFEWKGRKGLR